MRRAPRPATPWLLQHPGHRHLRGARPDTQTPCVAPPAGRRDLCWKIIMRKAGVPATSQTAPAPYGPRLSLAPRRPPPGLPSRWPPSGWPPAQLVHRRGLEGRRPHDPARSDVDRAAEAGDKGRWRLGAWVYLGGGGRGATLREAQPVVVAAFLTAGAGRAGGGGSLVSVQYLRAQNPAVPLILNVLTWPAAQNTALVR
jgi:hypothetical protein